MANNEHTLQYRKIEEDKNDTRHGLELLRHNVRNQSLYLDDDIRPVNMQAEKRGTRNGLNFQLPGNIDFRVEDNRIMFSEFGMGKEELQTLYKFLAKMGFSGLSVPSTEDEPFKELVKEAYDGMSNAEGLFEGPSFNMESREAEDQNTPPAPANTNIPASIPNLGISAEEMLAAKRQSVDLAKENLRPKALPKTLKTVHPCVDDIESFMDAHIRNTQKYKSNNYRKRSTSNGWELMIYKDSDQKKEGPTADKKGKVNPNFEFGLKGEIVKEGGAPRLKMTFMTPKFGDMADWMFDEVMNMADECKITHIKFNAGFQHKSKFFTACGKKLMIPTGIKLKEKDIKAIRNAATENNDDPAKRAAFYIRLADQLEENMRNERITDEAHPFVRIIKELRDDARNESEINKSAVKFKRFNQFFEGNILGKVYTDESDTPLNAFDVRDDKDKPNTIKELATGKAYVQLLSLYINDSNFATSSPETLKAKYLEFYNQNLYKVDKDLRKDLGDYRSNDRKSIKEVIGTKYEEVQSSIAAIKDMVSNDLGFDKLETPQLRRIMYFDIKEPDHLTKRIQKGRFLEATRGTNIPLSQQQRA